MFVLGTADDVFAMAVRIEENGEAFYSAAAAKVEEPDVKKLFEDLAAMEASHIRIFEALRRELPGSFPADAVWDPDGVAESYLQTTADTHVFTAESTTERLAQVKTPIQALEMALQFEKDSVAFFVGMKELLPDTRGKAQIDLLIHSEMQHIQMIAGIKKVLARTGTATIPRKE